MKALVTSPWCNIHCQPSSCIRTHCWTWITVCTWSCKQNQMEEHFWWMLRCVWKARQAYRAPNQTLRVERHHSKLFLYPECLLYALACFVWGMDLVMYVLGKYAMGLMVTGAAACIRLLWPPETLQLKILACLGHMAELVATWLRLCLMKCILAEMFGYVLGKNALLAPLDTVAHGATLLGLYS